MLSEIYITILKLYNIVLKIKLFNNCLENKRFEKGKENQYVFKIEFLSGFRTT